MNNASDDITDDVMFDIDKEAERSGSGVIDDPFPVWASLLARGPVHEGTVAHCMGLPDDRQGMYVPGMTYFSVFSFAGVSEAFNRKDDFSSEFYGDIGVRQWLGDNLLSMDGLRHRRYRDLVQEYFQPTAAGDWWRARIITGLVEELVGDFENERSVDLNAKLCALLPMHTVTAAFGLAPDEGVEFRRQMQAANLHDSAPAAKAAAMAAALEILERVIRARWEEPRDDMISRLCQAELKEEDGSTRGLSLEEISAFCRLIVFAGGGTTWRQLGITIFALLNDRDQLDAVMADRSLVQKAILESARWCPNDPVFPRKAKRDTTLQGVEIPEGAVLHLCLAAANRDPSRWESPEKYDLFRPVQRSLAFAAGHHSCLGQHVAREEMSAALNALFDRFPNMRWDPAHEPAKLSGGLLARGPGPLHVLLN